MARSILKKRFSEQKTLKQKLCDFLSKVGFDKSHSAKQTQSADPLVFIRLLQI